MSPYLVICLVIWGLTGFVPAVSLIQAYPKFGADPRKAADGIRQTRAAEAAAAERAAQRAKEAAERPRIQAALATVLYDDKQGHPFQGWHLLKMVQRNTYHDRYGYIHSDLDPEELEADFQELGKSELLQQVASEFKNLGLIFEGSGGSFHLYPRLYMHRKGEQILREERANTSGGGLARLFGKPQVYTAPAQ